MLSIGDPLVVKYLIGAGSDVDAQDQVGHTAAMLCVLRNRPESPNVLGALLAAGVDVRLADGQGYTAMHHAVRMDNTECFATLMAHDAASLQCDSFFIQFQGKPLFYSPMRNFSSSAVATALSDSSQYSSVSPEICASATVFLKFLGVMGDPQENIAKLDTVESILSLLDDTKIAYCPSTTSYTQRREAVSLEELGQLLSQVEEDDREMEAIFQGRKGHGVR